MTNTWAKFKKLADSLAPLVDGTLAFVKVFHEKLLLPNSRECCVTEVVSYAVYLLADLYLLYLM